VTGARVVGVDFSGAQAAGRTTWLAAARDDGEALIIERLTPAADLPGGAVDRKQSHAALVHALCDIAPAIAGFDFPFGLPRELVDEGDWTAWLEGFVDRHATPEAFRAWCRGRTGGREWKRRTDREEKTPMCVYNLRLHRQTYYGLRDVVWPLVRAGAFAMPMQANASGSAPLLLETCPASLLKRCGLPTVYKGRTPAHRRARAAIVRWLEESRGVRWRAKRLRSAALRDAGGDALDGALASSSAHERLRAGQQCGDRLDPFRADALDEHYRIEARVYCG